MALTASDTAFEPDIESVRSWDRQIAGLDAVLADLDAPIAQIDSSFVAVGKILADCATQLSQVTAVFEALPKDLESDEIIEATRRLEDVIMHAREIAASFDDEEADLEALVQRVKAAYAPMSQLRKVIQMIGILAINARMVAAGITGEAGEFGVFTTDIADLSEKATQTIQVFFKAYEQLLTDLLRAADQRSRFQAQQQDALNRIAGRLGDNLDQIVKQREQSAASSIEAGKVTRDIGARFGMTVMAMQVGDSTRQRIEHIKSALEDIKDLMSGAAPAGVSVPDAWREASIAVLLRIQNDMLGATQADYDKDVVMVEHSLRALAVDGNLILTLGHNIYGQKDHEGESALRDLSEDMRQVTGILDACESDRRRLDAAAMVVGETVEQLLAHVQAVQDIEGHMRLVTLNAAVKCAQLGARGKALDVIAKQLREITADTVTSAKAALAVLNEAADRARLFIKSADGEATGRLTQLTSDAATAIGLFEQVDTRLSNALGQLDRRGCNADEKLEEAKRRFAQHATISQTLGEAHDRIADLAAGLSAPDAAALAAEHFGADLLLHQRKKYSMDRERQIHDRIAGMVPAATGPQPEPSASEDDDLGLF